MVRDGYKQTEVGMIPEDWNVNELGSLGKFKNGINKASEDFGHGSPFVNLMDVFGINSISEVEHLGLVNSNDAEKKVYDLKEGDILFIRSSVKPSGVGLTTVVTKDLPNTVYSGFLIRFRDSRKLETNFKKHCFSEEKFRQSVIANSTVSANTNINQDNLKKLNLTYPESWVEQRSIAQALSDVDALSAALNKLIAKKRNLKTATLQQLLTGKTRLPGLGGEWHEDELGTIAEIIDPHPSHRAPTEKAFGIPFIGIGDITPEGRIDSESARLVGENIFNEHRNRYCLEDGLIGIGRVASIGKVVRLRADVGKYVVSPTIAVIKAKTIDVDYLLYFLLSRAAIEQFDKISNGSTRQSVGMNVLRKIIINFPKNMEEQREIATVLSDIDSEIAALESRLAKTQAIKQGMMQELLTGRVRLKIET